MDSTHTTTGKDRNPTTPLPPVVPSIRSKKTESAIRFVDHLFAPQKSFTHDDILTSIPTERPPVARMSYTTPIDGLVAALSDLELSVEVRDRLTRTEVRFFDDTFIPKVKALSSFNVVGSYRQQLQALSCLTKAREHLKKTCPMVVDDLSGVIGKVLGALDGKAVAKGSSSDHVRLSSLITRHSLPSASPKFPEKIPLSGFTTPTVELKRSAGHKMFLHFEEAQAYFEIEGISHKMPVENSEKKIAFANIKSVGTISSTEVSVGTKDGKDIVLEMKEEKDAEFLVWKLERAGGVTAYTAKIY